MGKEHVAVAKEGLGAGMVDNDSAVGWGRDFECDPRRDVGLQGTSDDVIRQLGCRQYQVKCTAAGELTIASEVSGTAPGREGSGFMRLRQIGLVPSAKV